MAPRQFFPSPDKLQQIGLGFMPVPQPFASLSSLPGLMMPSHLGFPALPTLSTLSPALPTTLPATPQPAAASALTTNQQSSSTPAQLSPPGRSLEVFSSLSSSRLRKPFHKRRPAHMDKNMLFCHFCGRKETPEWRKGPSGPATLCNACGLQWAKKVRAQRASARSSSEATESPKKTTNQADSPAPSEKSSEEVKTDDKTDKTAKVEVEA